MNQLKIGFVVDDTLDKTDGVQQYVLSLGRWLSAQGHDVHYIVGESSRTDIKNVHSVARNVKVTFNQNKLSIPLPASKKKLRQLLIELDLDVLHVQMPYSPFMAAKAVKLAPKKTVIVGTFHILPFSWLERHATRVLGVVLRKNLRIFDSFLAVSEPAQTFARESFGINAAVLPNVIDVALYQSKAEIRKTDNDNLTIVFLGRLVPRKGVQELILAIAALPVQVRERLRVKVGGKGPLLPYLIDLVARHKMQDVFEFVGFVAESDKPSFLGSADIAVFPALSGESFGIVLIEAMAAGAGVVVGGDNPGYRSVLSGWPEVLINPSDTASFAHKLKVLLEDADLRSRLHVEQQQAVYAYDIQSVGPRLLKIYENTSRQSFSNVR